MAGQADGDPLVLRGTPLQIGKPYYTAERVAAGKVGNGSRPADSDKLARQMQQTLLAERRAAKKLAKQERVKGYEEGTKDALADIQQLEEDIRLAALAISAKVSRSALPCQEPSCKPLGVLCGQCPHGMVTQIELELLKLGVKDKEAVKDRALGKASRKDEVTHKFGLLDAIVDINETWKAP